VGSDFYANIATIDQQNAEGWTWVDCANLYLAGYPLTQWPIGATFDIRAYVKEIEGCFFLWMDNSFGLGDANGGWTTTERTMKAVNGNVSVTSAPFMFQVCNASTLGGRDMQYVFTAPTTDVFNTDGVVYALSGKFYNRLTLSDNTFEENGYTWTEIDYTNMYFRIPYDRTKTNIDDDSMYMKISLDELNDRYGMDIYLTESEGNYYLWMQNPDVMGGVGISGRWEWYYVADNKLCHTTFYNSVPNVGVYVQDNLVELW